MSNKRIIEMQQKQILRLYEKGCSQRGISKQLGIHRRTVKSYIELFESSGKLIDEILKPDTNLVEEFSIEPNKRLPDARYGELKELARQNYNQRNKPGFTIENLYGDYKDLTGDQGYSRTHFYNLIRELWDPPRGSLRLNHKYGENLYVDYAGKKLSYVDKATGDAIWVEVLVTILPASQYIYIEAMESQRQEDFIQGIINAMEYIGGSAKGIVTDNLKSAVTKAGKYQSTINKSLQGMALHYNTTIDPTRTYHPKDKALVEGAVKICYASIFYEVQKHTYFSLSQLNTAIKAELEQLNNRKLSNSDYSRKDQYNAEKEHLNALPNQRYEIKEYRTAKVQKMGYVLCSTYKNYYSVPYRYIGKQVELRYDSRSLEVYYKSERIALHTTSQAKGQYVTVTEHLSSNNQAYIQWSPTYFSNLAAQHGCHVQSYVIGLIEQRPYPEQAYKQVQGILALVKTYTASRVNKACQLATKHPHYTYMMIKEILSNNQDWHTDVTPKETKVAFKQHENVRGASYYQ